MSNIPTQTENPKGLHQRYFIQKLRKRTEEEMQNEADHRLSIIGEALTKRWFSKGIEVKEYELVPVDENAEYFVMRLDIGGSDLKHIAACRIGIHAYADAIYPHLPELAIDLKTRYPLL